MDQRSYVAEISHAGEPHLTHGKTARQIIRMGATVAAAVAFLVSPAVAQENPAVAQENTDLRTGAAFRRTLTQSLDAVTWQGRSLREALRRIAQTQRVAVMLDRRIDPGQTIEFSATGEPLEVVLQRLAAKYGAAACRVDSVIYVGPPETAELLPTIVALRREEIRKLSAARQRALLRATPWRWKRLTSPRDLLSALESEYGIRIIGKEKMPHDLWPAMQLPEIDFPAKLSLVLAGFHVTFKVSQGGQAVTIVPMPNSASLSKRYSAGRRAAVLAAQLARRFPAATVRAEEGELIVDGRWEVHDALERLLNGEGTRRPIDPSDAEKTYTLTVENKPVGPVIQALARQLGKRVEFDVSDERKLAEEVSVKVKEASLGELISAILSPASLKHEIAGGAIRVFD